jgi:hypothetical protein
MAPKPGLLGLYWGARAESLDACAEHVYESMKCLEALGYNRFYSLGRSRRAALKRPFETTASEVRKKLARGRKYTDIPRAPMVDLGWSLSLWSGDVDSEAYGLSVSCGAYSEYVSNSFVLKLPVCGIHSITSSADRACVAFDELVGIWKPEQGVLCQGSIDWKDNRIVAEQPLRVIRRGD